MGASIPASASAEVAAPTAADDDRELPPPRRRLAARVLGSPAGAIGTGLTLTVVVVAALAEILAPMSPLATTGPPLAAPSAAHPMGTDDLGRDLLSGVIHGTRTSLLVATATGVLVLAVGLAVGAVSGYRGGLLDDALMRGTELFQVLPRFFLAIMVIALFGPGLDRVVVVLGLTSWPLLARVVRAQVLTLREREYVQASIACGAGDVRVLLRQIVPNALPATIAYLALLLVQVLLLEASIGFLGLGDPNAISLGYLAGQAQRFLRVAWWLSFFPGAVLVAIVLGFNLLGDALTDALGHRPNRRRGRGPRR
jgi:peptide/nickel transport system permease protein